MRQSATQRAHLLLICAVFACCPSPLSAQGGSTPAPQILPASVAAVLAGAVFGDHCSPISDTTVMSSMASECNHIEHVRTQLPYALLAGAAACMFGFLPAGLGFPWWLSMAIGLGVLALTVRLIGRKPVSPPASSDIVPEPSEAS